jgi:hypothetical protein
MGENEELFVMFSEGKISSFEILSISCMLKISIPDSTGLELPGIKLVTLIPNFSLISLSLKANCSLR